MASAIWLYPNELHKNLNVYENAEKLAKYGLERVPSIEPRKGRWIWTENDECICSECGEEDIMNFDGVYMMNDFCPNCGADMRSDQ